RRGVRLALGRCGATPGEKPGRHFSHSHRRWAARVKETWGALFFLIRRSTWNRLARQVKRVKSPRYALAVLFGLTYFWFFFFRGISRSNVTPPATVSHSIGSIGAFAFWITAVLWWLTGGAGSALA